MKKSILHIVLSIALVFSILAPALICLVDKNADSITLIDLNEEENPKKGEKDIEEKNFVLSMSFDSQCTVKTVKKKLFNYYQEDYSIYSLVIFLPPPEFFI
ncbi:MAG: hypothetical protein V3U92_03980 [Cellulophaga sp.]